MGTVQRARRARACWAHVHVRVRVRARHSNKISKVQQPCWAPTDRQGAKLLSTVSWRTHSYTGNMAQFRHEMRKAWAFVDETYSSKDLLGDVASQAMLRLSARASHHEFPYSMGVIADLLSCTNGATTQAFPGPASPLMLPIFNINYPQTRKSSGFAAGAVIGRCIDEHVACEAKRQV